MGCAVNFVAVISNTHMDTPLFVLIAGMIYCQKKKGNIKKRINRKYGND